MDKIRFGVIGLGQRGSTLLKNELLKMDDVEITAICDRYQDRVKEACDAVEGHGMSHPAILTDDYHEVLNSGSVDIVLIAAAWEVHTEIAVASMQAGKYTALEVGGAYSIEDCWKLVHTYEKTKTPFMFLENCCYGERETMVLSMVRQGLFGKIAACSGAYAHDLRKEVAEGEENRHYRLRNYLSRDCDNYPTHELGPISKILDIHHGNRMVSLVSMSSAAMGLNEYVRNEKGPDSKLANRAFIQGDLVTTIIKCARGETIMLELDTCLPRYYSRKFTVHGTKGMYSEDGDLLFLDNLYPEEEHFTWQKKHFGNAEDYAKEFNSDIWKDFKNQIRGGHGGMDWLMLRDVVERFKAGREPAIDVYEAAAWMSICPLTEASIAIGGMPMAIPDFTGGKWVACSQI